jgi:ferric-chelate reductase [NAD(P)H]
MIDLDALYKIQYGLYVITSKFQDVINGQLATTLFQVTNEPIKVVVVLSKNTYTHELIIKSKVFAASVLSQDTPPQFIGTFGFRCGRECFKFADVNYEVGTTGCPLVLDHALVVLEAAVIQSLDLGTHTLFVGELKTCKKLRDGMAMTYEYYHRERKGISPKNAPTYQKKPE